MTVRVEWEERGGEGEGRGTRAEPLQVPQAIIARVQVDYIIRILLWFSQVAYFAVLWAMTNKEFAPQGHSNHLIIVSFHLVSKISDLLTYSRDEKYRMPSSA